MKKKGNRKAVKKKVITKKIGKAVKEQIWIQKFGETFRHKCYVTWCTNTITPFTYHAGHDIPRSKGGENSIENLYPICAACNCTMGNQYSIQEWINEYKGITTKRRICTLLICWLQRLFF